MRRSSIDLGTNTCLLLIAEVDPNSKIVTQIIEDHSTTVRLGQGVDQARAFHPEAMARTLEALKNYKARLHAHGLKAEDTIAVATSQARDAKNGSEFLERVQRELGFLFKIISGEQEARMSFEGALLPGMEPSHTVVIDIGGGSTELISQSGGQSIDMGSVRFTERYLKSDPVTDPEFWSCREAIDQELLTFIPWATELKKTCPELELLAVAGTATAIAAWQSGIGEYNRDAIDQLTLTRGDVHRLVEELKWRSVEERKQMTGIEEKRADVLLAGALILWRTMEKLGFARARVSTRGLRFGVLRGF